MSAGPSSLPVSTVQPTFLNVVKDVSDGVVPWEDIWVSCYPSHSPSNSQRDGGGAHGKLRVVLDEVDRNLVMFQNCGDGDAKLERVDLNKIRYTISSPGLNIPSTKIFAPAREYTDSYYSNPESPHRITAFDVAPDGQQFAMGFLDGGVALCPTGLRSAMVNGSSTNGSAHNTQATSSTVKSRPHKSTLTSLKFFPSSRVLLSSSADFSVSILSASEVESDGVPLTSARTFMGHTRSVTSTAIVGVGKTVISSGADGTVRVWDVPGAKQVSIEWLDSAVNALALADESTLYTATSGGVHRFDLRTPQQGQEGIAQERVIQGGGSKLGYHSEGASLAIGDSRGLVRVFDVRSLERPVAQWKRGAGGSVSATEDLTWIDKNRLAVCTSDGLPYVASLGEDGNVKVDGEIVGPDCYATRRVCTHDGGAQMWTAADDGLLGDMRFGKGEEDSFNGTHIVSQSM
ncbi:WD40 repeat-like protein [Hymenopellis radicata]|nr:WD40 repeat-like protein [Hymenopellis radicata]